MFQKLKKSNRIEQPRDQNNSEEVPRESVSTKDHEKLAGGVVDTKIPLFTWRSLVMGLFVSMGGFLFGYDTGQISGFLEMNNFLLRYGEPGAGTTQGTTHHFSNVRAGLIVGLVSFNPPCTAHISDTTQLSIGTLIGALTAAPIADRIGRKWSISGWCLIVCIGVTVQISSPFGKWYQVAVGRLIAGLGVGAVSLLVPMYQAEAGPRHIRGTLIRYAKPLYMWCIKTHIYQHLPALHHPRDFRCQLYQLRN